MIMTDVAFNVIVCDTIQLRHIYVWIEFMLGTFPDTSVVPYSIRYFEF